MLDADSLAMQQQLLSTYRRTLSQLCLQAAQYGGERFAPPAVANGIHEAREQVRRIKAVLRASGADIDDHPDDEPPAPEGAPASAGAAAPVDSRQGVVITGGTVSGQVAGFNSGTMNYHTAAAPGRPAPSPARRAQAALLRAGEEARAAGDEDLADDLESITLVLQSAIRAEDEGKAERCDAKTREAREALGRLETDLPAVREARSFLDGR